MGVEVFRGEDLSAGGADLAVQFIGRIRKGGRLPRVLLALVFLASSRLLLQSSAVSVSRQQLLLFARVGQQHQQLVEDAVEVFSKQIFAAAVILSGGDHTLSELCRVVFELVELRLIIVEEFLNG